MRLNYNMFFEILFSLLYTSSHQFEVCSVPTPLAIRKTLYIEIEGYLPALLQYSFWTTLRDINTLVFYKRKTRLNTIYFKIFIISISLLPINNTQPYTNTVRIERFKALFFWKLLKRQWLYGDGNRITDLSKFRYDVHVGRSRK